MWNSVKSREAGNGDAPVERRGDSSRRVRLAFLGAAVTSIVTKRRAGETSGTPAGDESTHSSERISATAGSSEGSLVVVEDAEGVGAAERER